MEPLPAMVAAIGLEHSNQIRPSHVFNRTTSNQAVAYEEAYHFLKEGELLNGCDHPQYKSYWEMASVNSF